MKRAEPIKYKGRLASSKADESTDISVEGLPPKGNSLLKDFETIQWSDETQQALDSRPVLQCGDSQALVKRDMIQLTHQVPVNCQWSAVDLFTDCDMVGWSRLCITAEHPGDATPDIWLSRPPAHSGSSCKAST